MNRGGLLFIILFSSYILNAQVVLNGNVRDINSRQSISGAVVTLDASDVKITNTSGSFTFKIQPGKHFLKVEKSGYKVWSSQIFVKSDTALVVSLIPSQVNIEKVVVHGTFFDQTNDKVKINLKTAASLPSLTGETDLLKVAQFLPGVIPGSEGTVGLYIRGGDNYQNLYLLDGIPVYNISHVFNYLSSINPYTVKDFSIYKGGFPGYYSGRSSAVIDIKLVDPDTARWIKKGYIGVLNSSVFVNIPLSRHFALWIGGRLTYLDKLGEAGLWLYSKVNSRFSNEQAPYFNVGFNDFNTKATWFLNRSTKLSFSVFLSNDLYAVGDQIIKGAYSYKTGYYNGWNTRLYSLDFFKSFKHLSIKYLSGYQVYDNREGQFAKEHFRDSLTEYVNYGHYMKNIDLINKFILAYYRGSNVLTFHVEDIYHTFMPDNEVFDTTVFQTEVFRFNEFSASVTGDFQLKRFHVMFGLNFSGIQGNNVHYTSLNPRLSIAYKINSLSNLRISFDRTSQFFYGVTNFLWGLNYDLDIPVINSSGYLYSYQLSAEYQRRIKDFSMSIGSFYRSMTNLATMGDSFWNMDLPLSQRLYYKGRGWSYGLEFFIQKTSGRLTGQLAYTYSRSFRRFAQVNNGRLYPFRYDRPHSLNLVMDYKISDRLSFDVLWVFLSGYNITLPVARYLGPIEGYDPTARYFYYYTSRNNFRLPPYHRLDWVFNYKFYSRKKRMILILKAGVYNTYMRLNISRLDLIEASPYDKWTTLSQMRFYKYTFLPIMPIIGLKVDFK